VGAVLALQCNICLQRYADWEVSLDDWMRIDARLRPLNICPDCYLERIKNESALNGGAMPHLTITHKKKRQLYLYIQMEFCDRTLQEHINIIRDGSLPQEEIDEVLWDIFAQIVNGKLLCTVQSDPRSLLDAVADPFVFVLRG